LENKEQAAGYHGFEEALEILAFYFFMIGNCPLLAAGKVKA